MLDPQVLGNGGISQRIQFQPERPKPRPGGSDGDHDDARDVDRLADHFLGRLGHHGVNVHLDYDTVDLQLRRQVLPRNLADDLGMDVGALEACDARYIQRAIFKLPDDVVRDLGYPLLLRV